LHKIFRCLKTELSIRPNYHQKDENIEGHIHLGLLAYQVVSIIRYQLKQNGIKKR
jgi:transposase